MLYRHSYICTRSVPCIYMRSFLAVHIRILCIRTYAPQAYYVYACIPFSLYIYVYDVFVHMHHKRIYYYIRTSMHACMHTYIQTSMHPFIHIAESSWTMGRLCGACGDRRAALRRPKTLEQVKASLLSLSSTCGGCLLSRSSWLSFDQISDDHAKPIHFVISFSRFRACCLVSD
jgi:hypothetical protein